MSAAGPVSSGAQPTDSASLLGRYTRPSERSSTTSRRMFVSWSATPERVRERDRPVEVLRPEHGQREPAHRARHLAAVDDEIVDRLVRRADDVHLAAVDDLAEARHREPVSSGPRPPPPRAPGLSSADRSGRCSCERPASPVSFSAGAGAPVADVVDSSCQRVDRRQRPALGLSQQPDAVCEVLRFLARDGLAEVVGELGVHDPPLPRARRHHGGDGPLRECEPAGTAPTREHVVAGPFDGVERRHPPCGEAHDRCPGTEPERRCERRPPTASRPRARFTSMATRPSQRRGRVGPEQFSFGTPEALHVLGGQIDAPSPRVLSDVLKVLDDLQTDADLVG